MKRLNPVTNLHRSGTVLDVSLSHLCCRCGTKAAPGNQLVELEFTIDLGARVEIIKEVTCYIHRSCAAELASK